ncbi:MAG TPA: O-antigen ligase family protein [Candidatus Kapabacteria bacterium]|mgnify:CR=1 FL=1|jgi:hypothetical protein|nr:O-antigen ligase family protein [Candidatus Kapabacteria bacterium]
MNNKFGRYWIYSIFLLSPLYFRGQSEGVDFWDIFFAVYYTGTILFWFFWYVFIQKKSFIKNIADFFLFSFFFLCIFNIAISFLNGVPLMSAVREYLVFSYTLFYFPIKEYFDDKKSFINFLIILAISLIINDFGQYYDYYSKLEEGGLKYAYQLGAAVRINQPIYSFTLVSGIILFFIPQNKSTKFLIFILVVLTTIALILTFSRTFWLIVIMEIVLLLFFFPIKYKYQLTIYIGSIAIIFVIVANIFFGDISKVLFQVLENRLTSTTMGRADLSVQTRLDEYKVAISRIKEYPMGGNGFAKKFPYYNSIIQLTYHSHIIHNGYLFIMYRVGIPMAILYFFCVIYFFFKSLITTLRLKDLFYKFISLCGFLGVTTMIIGNITSPQFTFRDGAFVVALCFAFSELAYQYFISNERTQEEKILTFIEK